MGGRPAVGGAASEADRAPFVSVVLPVRDAAVHLPDTLAALLAGDYPADRMEVLVAEGGSRDDTRALVEVAAGRDRRVRLVDNPAGTTPAGLNAAIRAARGEIVVRLDGHARPAPDYVRTCVDALRRTGADAVGGPMVGRGVTAFGAAVALATASRLGAGGARFRLGGDGPTDTVYLGAWWRSLFERVGLFDEDLVRNQDYELAQRVREAGGTVWLDPAIRTSTVTRSTPGDLARQYLGYGAGRAATLARHPGSLRPRQAVPALFVAALVVGVLGAPWWRPARWALAGLMAAYGGANVAASMALARRGPAERWPGGWRLVARLVAAFTILHVAWGAGFWLGLAREARWSRDA